MLGILAWVESNEFEDDGQAWQVTPSHWDLKVAKPGDLISYCWGFVQRSAKRKIVENMIAASKQRSIGGFLLSHPMLVWGRCGGYIMQTQQKPLARLSWWKKKQNHQKSRLSEKNWQFEQIMRRRASIAKPTPQRLEIRPSGKQTKRAKSFQRRFTNLSWELPSFSFPKGWHKACFQPVWSLRRYKVDTTLSGRVVSQSRYNNIQAILKGIGPIVILFHALLIFPFACRSRCVQPSFCQR